MSGDGNRPNETDWDEGTSPRVPWRVVFDSALAPEGGTGERPSRRGPPATRPDGPAVSPGSPAHSGLLARRLMTGGVLRDNRDPVGLPVRLIAAFVLVGERDRRGDPLLERLDAEPALLLVLADFH